MVTGSWADVWIRNCLPSRRFVIHGFSKNITSNMSFSTFFTKHWLITGEDGMKIRNNTMKRTPARNVAPNQLCYEDGNIQWLGRSWRRSFAHKSHAPRSKTYWRKNTAYAPAIGYWATGAPARAPTTEQNSSSSSIKKFTYHRPILSCVINQTLSSRYDSNQIS